MEKTNFEKGKSVLRGIFYNMKHAIKSYRMFRKYMFRQTGNLYSKRNQKLQFKEHRSHDDYAYYINNSVVRFMKLFDIFDAHWEDYIKKHNIVRDMQYSQIYSKILANDKDENTGINGQLQLMLMDVLHSSIDYNVTGKNNGTDDCVNIITLSHIYHDFATEYDDEFMHGYMHKKSPIVYKYKHEWVTLCRHALEGFDDDDINSVD